MKRGIFFILFFAALFSSFAQDLDRELPVSWTLNLRNDISPIELPPIDLAGIAVEDSINDLDKSIPWRYGLARPIVLNLQNDGTWTDLDNGDRIWQVAIKSPQAINMSVNFEDFYLPEGARLHLYNEDRTDISRTYSNSENRDNKRLASWFVTGETIFVEYFEPQNISETVELQIGSIIHGYRINRVADYIDGTTRGLNDSDACNYDVNCSIGDDFDSKKDMVKKAVALLNLGNGFLCSAALMNNTAEDKRPLLLTANHCLESSDPSLWVIRFNWMSPNPICGNEDESNDIQTNFTMSGAELLASNEQSDFALVEMQNKVPSSWDVTFAGWDSSDDLPEFEVGIHHPSGDIMKICRDDSGAVRENANGVDVWLIGGVSVGAGDGWEIGTTESGSSGSPLFNENGHVIGQLYAGQSSCSGTENNNDYDIYGRFGVSWNAGSSQEDRLMEWLDPIGSGQTILESKENILGVPDIDLEGQVQIYPNPASTTISIMNGRYPSLVYNLYTMVGQKVMGGPLSSTLNQINVEALSQGIYILHLIDKDSNADITKKIIIEK